MSDARGAAVHGGECVLTLCAACQGTGIDPAHELMPTLCRPCEGQGRFPWCALPHENDDAVFGPVGDQV